MLSLRHDALPKDLAEGLLDLYESADDWTVDNQHKVYGLGHQHFSGPHMPLDGELYRASFFRSPKLEAHASVQEAAGLIGGRILRCYRMETGQGFRIHNDDYFGGDLAHTLYLSPTWIWDWGGILHVLDENNQAAACCPEFNLLATIDRVPHFVSPVAPWAQEPRYTLSVFGR